MKTTTTTAVDVEKYFSAVELIALSTKFSLAQLVDLLPFIKAANDKEVSLALLLGVYVFPNVSEKSIQDKRECSFISFTLFPDRVNYSYEKEDTTYDRETSTYVANGKMLTRESYCSLSTWEKTAVED